MSSKNKTPKQKEPERSLPLRLVVLAAMLVPLLALARVHSGLWPHVILAGCGIGLGHWYSYRFVDRSTAAVRAIMFMLIHLALCWLVMGLAIGATVPQAQFAIFAQAITSFDLKYRRSLFNTLIHSLANLYVAATLSRTYELFIYLAAFTALVLVAFYVAAKEDGVKTSRTRLTAPTERQSMTLFGLSFGAIILLAIFVMFMFVPRFANNPVVPPFTINIPLEGGIQSEIINPGVPLVQVNGWSNETGDYFYGFDTNLDLRYRGGLSDEIVMYVRSPSRSYWRSHNFDTYSGVSWSQSDKTLTELEPKVGVYYELDTPLGAPIYSRSTGQQQRVVQSFTIVRRQPNLVFAAYRPKEIYITASKISIDSGDGLRLPEELKPGFTYSVVSLRPDFDPERLRQASTRYPPQITARYLQLPDISQRVKNLAGRLTAPYDNPYDKVMALNNHLRAEYPYNYFPPPLPPGAEVVDTFLFEDQEGVCEQYVTALVVMARALGIPARLTTGYGAGTYNPITNYYEVRLSDAHSWAEVYFPGHGWVPFDPTPGWTPQPYPTPVQNWLFANQGRFLDLRLPAAPLEQLANSPLLRLNVLAPLLVGLTFVIGVIWGLIYILRNLPKKRPADQPMYSSLPPDPRRTRILQLYNEGTNLVSQARFRPRHRWEALTEYARQVRHLPALSRLTQAAEMAAYRNQPPDAQTVSQAEAALEELDHHLAPGGKNKISS